MKANGKEKIVVIGGGIAGLTAGIYALRAGFEAEIFEKNAIDDTVEIAKVIKPVYNYKAGGE